MLEERVEDDYYGSGTSSSSNPQSPIPNSQYVWGLRYVDDLILRDRDTSDPKNGILNERLYALQDANWNVVALAEPDGDIVERFIYDAYGKATPLDPDFTAYSGTDYAWPYLFTGRRLDEETGLMHYRNRYYHTRLGRFINRDPIGYEGNEWNLYQYVHDRPVHIIDPYGLGPFATRIKSIKSALANHQRYVAACEAKMMYDFIANWGSIRGYPMAARLINRWLDKVGGTLLLEPDEVNSIIKDAGVKASLNKKIKALKLTGGGEFKAQQFTGITANDGTDLFHSLGWFRIVLTGKYCVTGRTVQFKGMISIGDRYDWQNPGEKFVMLAGDKIFDKYATLVEDFKMATAFDIIGSAYQEKEVEFDINGGGGGGGR